MSIDATFSPRQNNLNSHFYKTNKIHTISRHRHKYLFLNIKSIELVHACIFVYRVLSFDVDKGTTKKKNYLPRNELRGFEVVEKFKYL